MDYYRTNSSEYSCAKQDEVFDKISHSYDRATSYYISLVVFQESKLCIGINVSTDYLKAAPTPLNGSSNSVISGITTLFLLINIDKNNNSVKITQSKSSKYFLDDSIHLEGTKLMSSFDNR